MKKILILGCSFSSGAYELGAPRHEAHWPEGRYVPDHEIHGSKGWYHYVDYFKNEKVTVIDFPGQGYWSWYSLLLMLEGTNRLNYDEMWLQETDSPRAKLVDLKKIELDWDRERREIDNITKFQVNNANTREMHLNPYNFYETLEKNIAQNIQELCTKIGMSGYVWTMYQPIMKCKEFRRLPLVNIHNELRKKELLVYDADDGHQTEEGNKYIGKLINEALCIDMMK